MEEAWLARLAAPAAYQLSLPQCYGQLIQPMEFAPQTEQSGKESPIELFPLLQVETPLFTCDYSSLGSTATQGPSKSPVHLWEGRYTHSDT